MVDEARIRNIVRQVVQHSLGLSRQPSPTSHPQPPSDEFNGQSPVTISGSLITERDILSLPRSSEIRIPSSAALTPLARDHIVARRIRVVRTEDGTPSSHAQDGLSSPTGRTSTAPHSNSIAIGSDHGGFELKQELIMFLRESGCSVQDCGTDGVDSVDYPDYAYAVARLVADGRAERGIIVDGVGIGSCMAANKVPGIRAAMCYDLSTARNSREHNDANVLTLGGKMIGLQLARQIVQSWLSTTFAGGRHGRRVDKIMDIERRFVRR